MEWQVQGADKTTGEARSMKVVGQTRDEAEQRVLAFGILSSSCVPIDTPFVKLERDVGRVRFWDRVVWCLGAVSVFAGFVLLVLGLLKGVDLTFVVSGAATIVNGGVMLSVSALMSLFASMGDALRDIARKD